MIRIHPLPSGNPVKIDPPRYTPSPRVQIVAVIGTLIIIG